MQHHKNQPLGLPTGSVRSILALLITGGFVAVAMWHQDIQALKEIALMILAYYYGTRSTRR